MSSTTSVPSVDEPLKVIFIAGAGHSGSTVLDKVVGHVKGFASCGEVRHYWSSRLCSCGARVEECPYWTSVFRRAFGEHPWIDIAELVDLQFRAVRTRPTKLLAMSRSRRPGSRDGDPFARYSELRDRLYAAIAEESGARVLVDSTKVPGDAYAAAIHSRAELYVVQLVRDPRRVAASWERAGQMSPLKSSAYWLWWNSILEVLLRREFPDRFLRVTYEDFCADPQRVVRSICTHVGEPDAQLPRFLDERTVELGRTHMLGGNVSVFSEGATAIAEPGGRRAPARIRLLSTLPALPLLRRYGYPLLGG
jgi:hypothetical protein